MLLGATTGASFLAGYPHASVLLAYAWASLLFALLVGTAASPRDRLAAAGLFVLALLIGALISSIQMLPALELAQLSTRK